MLCAAPRSRHRVAAAFATNRHPWVSRWRINATRFFRPRGEYADTSAERTVFYAYTLVAEDSTGLRSAEALPVQGRVFDSGRRRGASGLTATAVDAGVQVMWQAAVGTESRWLVVYRADADGDLVPLRSTGAETALLDRVLAGTYRYAVQVMYRDGGMSAIAEPVAVTERRR